ncbi:MAG: MarR family transcriptional regulator [Nanoarchaeota archaeon]
MAAGIDDMDNKKIGIILLIVGIMLVATIFLVKAKEDLLINKIINEKDSCFLDDGTCLHADRDTTGYIIGWIFSSAIIALGSYLLFFEKSQKEIVKTLENQKHIQVDSEKFDILLKGLDNDEKKVIKAIKEQDGITQSTLALRTDLHKSKLSIVLEGLEKKELISRKEKGKTKEVFLKINL